jgi:hypothetical protein
LQQSLLDEFWICVGDRYTLAKQTTRQAGELLLAVAPGLVNVLLDLGRVDPQVGWVAELSVCHGTLLISYGRLLDA